MVMFREIHKNTWLKRLTAEGKKITIGPKKSERSWVVFCVHDDTEALLEGYADPRQAPSHNPEWIVPMQDTLHISHALIPNSHEFEFVVTLSNEVVRFHAMSWDIMQEWVETLRSKLREMKILSPRENLYTKLPEIRAPLLPTRDPTSPLPAPPPVPAALVPGVERVIPPSSQTQNAEVTENPGAGLPNTTNADTINSIITSNVSTATAAAATTTTTTTTTSLFTSMSNTLTQNLLNMLSDPISAYSEQINDAVSMSSMEGDDIAMLPVSGASEYVMATPPGELLIAGNFSTENDTAEPLLRNNYHPVSNSNDFRNLAAHRFSADQIQNLESILQCECHIPRPQTSRSLSVGAADKSMQAAKQPTHNSGHLKQTIQEDINHMEQRAGKPLITNNKGNNVTELEVNAECDCDSPPFTHSLSTTTSDSNTNITIIQVSTAENDVKSDAADHENVLVTEQALLPLKSTNSEIFTFSDVGGQESAIVSNNIPRKLKQHEYKSNVQIIPSTKCNDKSSSRSNSCISTTVQIMGQKQLNQKQNPKITTVHVAGNEPAYGTCFESMSTAAASSHNMFTPKMSKKIILSSNAACITNITVNTKTNEHAKHSRHKLEESGVAIEEKCGNAIEENLTTTTNAMKSNSSKHYEKVFLSSSSSVATVLPDIICDSNGTTITTSPKLVSPSQTQSMAGVGPLSPSSHVRMSITEATPATRIAPKPESSFHNKLRNKGSGPVTKSINAEIIDDRSQSNNIISPSRPSHPRISSPALARRRIVSPLNMPSGGNPLQLMHAVRPPFVLKRGLTEAVITSRPSRRDFPFLNKIVINKKKSNAQLTNITNAQRSGNQNTNNNTDNPGPSVSSINFIAANRLADEAFEQRRRSSSTSDANHEQQQQRHGGGGGGGCGRGTNNNELSNYAANAVLRSTPQQQQFSLAESGISSTTAIATTTTTTTTTHSPAAGKRMSLREQQVMQLRREIMHPGGVRLQLRRKDCVGSIAWVDVFGAVWVAGWKQKEHPVLYNALHIGDQLLSVAGMTINSANEANKIIRNTNTLFVEVLVRRIPMGRGYAIRRDRECQCLGLIRDGNTATIVDVIPNSLAARHGLPPKAQSFDGTTLTCWMLTEINGRPLNLFFKDNEIRDRLNSVGRDISILVQPSDLITKLKKQLKSLRGYKEYLVQ